MADDEPKQQPQQPGQAGPKAGLDELARRYVDLWQDQVTALAADPDFAESLQKAMAALGVAASGQPAAWAAWPAAFSSLMAAARPGDERGQQSDGRKPAAAAGAASAAAAPDGGGADLGELEKRLAALERRLAALEGSAAQRSGAEGGGRQGGTGGTRRRAKAKPRGN